MEFGSGGALNTVGWPDSAASVEMNRLLRVPVPRCKDGQTSGFELLDLLIQNRDDLVPLRNGQFAALTKVLLNINQEKSVVDLHQLKL